MKKTIILNTMSFTLLLFLTMASLNSFGQNFVYKTVPLAYVPTINPTYVAEVKNYKTAAVDLTKYLPANFVKDGSVDYTTQIQSGINLNKVVLMPNFPILTSGISATSNSTILFQKDSKLVMGPSEKEGYNILKIKNVHDVNVYFANIVGDRKQHLGSKGEWGFGIGIISAYNIKIVNPAVSDCWGDGIYINNVTPQHQDQITKSSNILIDGANLDNNRRNGLSLIDGKDITIKNSVCSNTNGTSPMAGLDVEPNNGHAELKNITLDRIVAFNNQTVGILVSLAVFKSENQKQLNLNINNCTVDSSNYGIGFSFERAGTDGLAYAKGTINVTNTIWKNNNKGELWLPYPALKNVVNVNISNSKVYKSGAIITDKASLFNLNGAKNIIIQ
ncbi:hypothetical protein ACVWYG_003439 [Pedobacter sp. UYEF25]